MNEEIKLKVGEVVNGSMASIKWSRGILIDTVTMADYHIYGVIKTEHGEFDLVPIYSIVSVKSTT